MCTIGAHNSKKHTWLHSGIECQLFNRINSTLQILNESQMQFNVTAVQLLKRFLRPFLTSDNLCASLWTLLSHNKVKPFTLRTWDKCFTKPQYASPFFHHALTIHLQPKQLYLQRPCPFVNICAKDTTRTPNHCRLTRRRDHFCKSSRAWHCCVKQPTEWLGHTSL